MAHQLPPSLSTNIRKYLTSFALWRTEHTKQLRYVCNEHTVVLMGSAELTVAKDTEKKLENKTNRRGEEKYFRLGSNLLIPITYIDCYNENYGSDGVWVYIFLAYQYFCNDFKNYFWKFFSSALQARESVNDHKSRIKNIRFFPLSTTPKKKTIKIAKHFT